MSVQTVNFTTGPSTLPDVGTLSYNGCTFSPLFVTTVSGDAIKDNAQRTIKYMKYTITVDGYVTLPAGATSINGAMSDLRRLLSAQGGELIYRGRGFDLEINLSGAVGAAAVVVGGAAGFASTTRDVAWGPIPEVIEFQPLGGGRSAKVQWKVVTHVPETKRGTSGAITTGKLGRLGTVPFLQFNYETSVTYNEDGYSSLNIHGILEIPLTRTPSQNTRTLTYTVDDFRQHLDSRIVDGINLAKFRIVRREFSVSRDKRTLEWEFVAEEKSYMDLPPDCTIARGTYSVRPAKAGAGLALWLCTLRGTYTVSADKPRRVAWFAFLALLRLRMSQSCLGYISPSPNSNQNPILRGLRHAPIGRAGTFVVSAVRGWRDLLNNQKGPVGTAIQAAAIGALVGATTGTICPNKAILLDFSIEEGLYADSKTTSFSATWKLTTTFSHILLASGVWKKLPEEDDRGNNLWETSMRSISGWRSWETNELDPNSDIIVDFGSR